MDKVTLGAGMHISSTMRTRPGLRQLRWTGSGPKAAEMRKCGGSTVGLGELGGDELGDKGRLVHRTLKGAALAERGPLGCLTVLQYGLHCGGR